ncbi:MAG TPA: AmpG family muropeptide MFS transporter [Stellaceae bacterium]|nr:AmpG family muropeptide MFS transporter [Stellaceae bacterium]
MKAAESGAAPGWRNHIDRNGWLEALAVYRRPRLVAILLMGFSSGLPLALTGATLSLRLADLGVSLTAIGLFTLVRFSYSCKFLWSPLIDRLPLPGITARLGRRRGWALAIQLALALAILALGFTDPTASPWSTAIAAIVVAFLSASQDIVIDAYRIELLRPEEQGAGAAATQWGYRFGMIASGAGALYAASFGGWTFAYVLMAVLMLVGMATVWLTPEPSATGALEPLPGATAGARARAWIARAVVAPFVDMFRRGGVAGAVLILLFVVLYKVGDAIAGSVSGPFYLALGFSKLEIATVAKVYGVVATLVGVAIGGAMVLRFGVFRALLIGGVLQLLSNVTYVMQVWAGHDVAMLAVTIGVENLTSGMGSAAFVAYLSGLCNLAFTATQYALLSSLATTGVNILSASGGYLAETLGWVPFFLLSMAMAVPGLLLLLWLMRNSPPEIRPQS